MKRRSFHLLVCGLASLGMFLHPPSAVPITGQWGVIFAIDAPWRLEPMPTRDGHMYGQIPIVISFRQAINEVGREYGTFMRRFVQGAGPEIGVGKVIGVEVVEVTKPGGATSLEELFAATTRIPAAQFREIERKRVLSTKGDEPLHELCYPYLGQDCSLNITDTDEWHAMFWYAPRAAVTPGRNIHLQVLVTTVSGSGNDLQIHEWLSFLVVHAGEAPLPRFANNWLYGDLHYHSQMTGNEAEYGHSYRNVARVLGTMGLDFAFTTDHASNGEQTLGRVTTGRCGSPDGTTCSNHPQNGYETTAQTTCDAGDGKSLQCMTYSAIEARDLNAYRFAAAKTIIYGPGGANEAVARDAEFGFGRLRSANVLPQIYMGEEVDAMPEMSSKEYQDGVIYYGDGLKYPWPDVYNCMALPASMRQSFCFDNYSMPYAENDRRSYIVRDSQGPSGEKHLGDAVFDWTKVGALRLMAEGLYSLLINADTRLKTGLEPLVAPARQHLLYFPTDAGVSTNGWVSGDTGRFGGSSKYLADVIREIEANRGATFLAHPLDNARPGGYGRGVVPYSDTALNRAWSSPAVLGLQFWNEHYSRIATLSPGGQDFGGQSLMAPFQYTQVNNFPWTWPKYISPLPQDLYLYDGAYTWDRYLRKGLNPTDTAPLTWLLKGEPRKWFMAGGSDAHGDFNYRQTGYICDHRWCIDGIMDTAIGRPRNLVFVSQPPAGAPIPDLPTAKRYTNTQVLDALRTGQFSITNGPAIRIAIDKNRNGKIDDADFQMGSTFNLYPGEQIPLLIEWMSSPEFGPIAQVDVYLGTPSFTYATKGHGPVIPTGPAYSNAPPDRNREYGAYRPDPSGVLQLKLVAENSGENTVPGVSPAMRYHGVAKLFLSPGQFGLSTSDQLLFYLRAFAKTRPGIEAARHSECPTPETAGNSCGDGLAYSNPIWGRYQASCPPRKPKAGVGPPGSSALDGDNNGVPDICERDIPDLCPPATGRPDLGARLDNLESQPTAPIVPTQKKAPGNSCQVVMAAEKFGAMVPSSGGAAPAIGRQSPHEGAETKQPV